MEFVGKVVTDWGAAVTAPLVVIGDRLGLYRAMSDGEPITPAELASRTGTDERYLREWLASQAAGGYVGLDADGLYHLPPEQAVALTDESSPACVLGGFQAFVAAMQIAPQLEDAFRTGDGIGWGAHHPDLFAGTARFFKPGYVANLTTSWLPALDDAASKLRSGARVADIGCGFGHSTAIMAEAFPLSLFIGFDAHAPSIDAARKLAADKGLSTTVEFHLATAKEFDRGPYDLITYFDCLHDMGDPVGALAHARANLATDGSVMIVEPYANDSVRDNMNPVGRLFYSVSTMVCTPASKSEEVGAALGAQAGEARTRAAAHAAGFTRFRRATETPFNIVYEARP